jgi:hypothetical protein
VQGQFHLFKFVLIILMLRTLYSGDLTPYTPADIYLGIGRTDRLCGLVVRVPGYRSEMYCVSCEVRKEFIYVM